MDFYVLTMDNQVSLSKPLRKASRRVGEFIGRVKEDALKEYL